MGAASNNGLRLLPKTTSPTRGQFPQRAVVEKADYEARCPRWEMGGRNYFKELLIEVNLSFSVVPRLFTTVMIASAIPAAIRPYSIAVAPDSSDQNFETMRFKIRLRFHLRVCWLVPTSGNLRGTTYGQVNPGTASYTENWEQKFQKLNLTEP